jgi:DNA repair protein RecN (Recombination protein N)
MLHTLIIKNLAVVSEARVDFASGLNVLTGETGAGKSIIVDALGWLLGARAAADMLRAGETRATIEAYFDLKEERAAALMSALAPLGFDEIEGGELIVRREIYANGRGRFFINDRGVTAHTLRRLQPFLIEIYGQGEQQSLLTARSHLDLLDEFGGCAALRRATGEAFEAWRRARENVERLQRDAAERERTAEFLRYQLTAIREVDPKPSEDVELEKERRRLAQGERLLELCAESYGALYESEASVLERLAFVRRRLQALSEADGKFKPSVEVLETAQATLEDVADQLRRYQIEFDFSPERLAEIEERLLALERLRRKLGRNLAEVSALRAELESELERLENLDDLQAEARREVEKAGRLYVERARALSARRRAVAPELEKSVMRELAHLALERAEFKVQIETAGLDAPPQGAVEDAIERDAGAEILARGNASWSPRGSDNVEFYFAANVGEAARPLGRVASGGELSRLMLALRTSVQDGAGKRDGSEGGGRDLAFNPTMIFDEVDAGIGGRTAEAVGRRLKRLAAQRQVLCVTHQAQLARFADAHFVVTKRVAGGRTLTEIARLDGRGRVGELARMIGGTEKAETARATARWMLKNADGAEAARDEREGEALAQD